MDNFSPISVFFLQTNKCLWAVVGDNSATLVSQVISFSANLSLKVATLCWLGIMTIMKLVLWTAKDMFIMLILFGIGTTMNMICLLNDQLKVVKV